MKYLLFVVMLCFGSLLSCAQSVDSAGARKRGSDSTGSGTGHRPTLWERRRQAIQEREREMHMSREERLAEIESRPYYKADSAKWSLSFNPFSWLELQGALGVGIGYQISPHVQVWVESSALFQMYKSPDQSCLGGIREIAAIKYYFGPRRSVFFAGEFRYKNVYFHDVNTFYYNDTVVVHNFTYKIQDIVFGGALWFGGQIRISRDHRWRLEPSIGMGVKGRTVVWHDVPAGYTYPVPNKADPFSNPVRTPEQAIPYFPATVRIIYVL